MKEQNAIRTRSTTFVTLTGTGSSLLRAENVCWPGLVINTLMDTRFEQGISDVI